MKISRFAVGGVHAWSCDCGEVLVVAKAHSTALAGRLKGSSRGDRWLLPDELDFPIARSCPIIGTAG